MNLVALRVANQHAFGAAKIEPGECGFVSHVSGVLQHVANGIGFVRIRPHAQATQCRTQHGAMDRDYAAQAAVAMMKEHHLLVTEPAHCLEQVHRRSS
jgi:hypothetical protein